MAEEEKRMPPETERSGRRPVFPAGHPIRLIGGAYGHAIAACGRSDARDALRSILELRETMRAAGPDEMPDLLRVYDACIEQIQAGDFASARAALEDLHRAWTQTEDRLSSRPE